VIYKVDKTRVVPFGFKTLFGGGRSTGFALIYDSEEAQKKFEPRYRLVRVSAPPFRALSIMTTCFRLIGRPCAQGGEGFP
jgi:ribosomal protein S24E